MPLPPLGTKMVRVDDGKKGCVVNEGDEPRIAYWDRDSLVIAPKREHWEAEQATPRRLRHEEIEQVAAWADRSLRSLERHEPLRYWEEPATSEDPYDAGLREAIITYLKHRG